MLEMAMLGFRFSFGLAWFVLVWFISLFERNGGENTGGENSRGTDLAVERASGEKT